MFLNQTSLLSVWCIQKCWYIFIAGCYHDVFKIGNVTYSAGCLHMKELTNSHKGHGYGHSPCGKACSCMHNVLLGISSVVQCSSSNGTIWKSSSSSLSSSRHTGVLVGVVLAGGETSSEVSLSSDELNDSHLHTGLGRV